MPNEQERLRILEMIEQGLISTEDGLRLLNALDGEDSADLTPEASVPSLVDSDNDAEWEASSDPEVPDDEPEPERIEVSSEQIQDPAGFSEGRVRKFRSWWWIPMWIGVAITVVAGGLMFLAYQSGGFGFWFACTWFPFLLGVAVMALAWGSRSARWLHVRVHQKEGERPQNISISLPLPLHLIAWFLRHFGSYIPNLDATGLDEVILALDKTSPDTPLYVEVNEGSNGERVEVYIG